MSFEGLSISKPFDIYLKCLRNLSLELLSGILSSKYKSFDECIYYKYLLCNGFIIDISSFYVYQTFRTSGVVFFYLSMLIM